MRWNTFNLLKWNIINQDTGRHEVMKEKDAFIFKDYCKIYVHMQQVKNQMSFLPQPCFDHGLLTLSIIILMLKHYDTFSICNLCHGHVHL